MSNSIGHNLLHNNLLHSTVLEHQSKFNSSGIPANSLYQVASVNQAEGKSSVSTKFYGTSLNVRKPCLAVDKCRPIRFIPCAVLAMNPASEQLARKYNLEGNIELQVTVGPSNIGSVTEVNLQVFYESNSLLLHWGGIRDRKEKWVFPSRQPDGTRNYKNRALRTPFSHSGSHSFLKLEIDDPAIQAIEFLIFDEGQNKWIKNNGRNFHVKLPMKKELLQNISVPEDLVQVQAYLRWERKGKQMYSPEQEKESEI